MGRFIAVGSDFHGNYSKLANLAGRLPAGTTVYYAGDMYGPSDRSFTESIKEEVTREKGKFSEGKFFEGIYREGMESTPRHRKYAVNSIFDTKKTVEEIVKSSARTPIGAIIPGNGEVYHEAIWQAYAGRGKPQAQLLRESELPYLEQPQVHFYKDGFMVEEDVGNVDTAVVVLPYVMEDAMAENLEKATGGKYPRGQLQNAINAISGIVESIRKANPKNVVQVQHEPPASSHLKKYFSEPFDPGNSELYRAAIKEISKIKNSKSARMGNYIVVYGHIDRGGRFSDKLVIDGNEIDAVHADEGNDFVLIDTRSGKVYKRNENPESEGYAEIAEVNLDFGELTEIDSSGLELIVDGEMAEAGESTD